MNRPSTSKPERAMSPARYVAGLAAIILGATGLIFAVSDDSAPPAPRADCVEALDAADALLSAASDAVDLISAGRSDELDVDGARRLRVAYDKAAKECRDV